MKEKFLKGGIFMKTFLRGVVKVSRKDEFGFSDQVYLCLFEDSAGQLETEAVWDDFFPGAINSIDLENNRLRYLDGCSYQYAIPNVLVEDMESYLRNWQDTLTWTSKEKFLTEFGFKMSKMILA